MFGLDCILTRANSASFSTAVNVSLSLFVCVSLFPSRFAVVHFNSCDSEKRKEKTSSAFQAPLVSCRIGRFPLWQQPGSSVCLP